MTAMDSQLIETYTCECSPEFIYRNKKTFKKYLGKIDHRKWDLQKQHKKMRGDFVILINDMSGLKLEMAHWKKSALQKEPIDFLS